MKIRPGAPDPEPPPLSSAILRWSGRRLGVPDLHGDAGEIYARRSERLGRTAAVAWYRRQARAALAAVATRGRSQRRNHRARLAAPRIESLSRELALAGRRCRLDPSRAASFAVVVGVGISATAFMIQVRTAMLRPDLGLGRDVALASWVDSAGRTSQTVNLTGGEPWLTSPPGSVGRLVALWPVSKTLTTPDGHVRVSGYAVGPDFLRSMGSGVIRGRDLEEAGEVVLADRFWSARWGRDPAVVGRSIRLDGASYLVVGVAQPGLDGPICCVPPHFWSVEPVRAAPSPAVLAGVEVRDPVAAATWLEATASESSRGAKPALADAVAAPYGGDGGIIGRTLLVLLLLAGIAWFGTLMSGANLVLADTLDRSNELRLRRALGSHPRHLVVRMVAETSWLAVGAACVAIAVTWIGVGIAPWLLPMIGGTSSVEVDLDAVGLGAIGGATAIATLVCSLPGSIVGLRICRSANVDRAPARGGATSLALAAQVALAVCLLAVTGAFVATVRSLDGDFVGFRDGRATVHYLSPATREEGFRPRVVAAALTGAGIAPVAVTRRLPVYGAARDSARLPSGEMVYPAIETVTDDFFSTIGADLLAGTTAADAQEAVISEDLALAFAGSARGAIGATVHVGDARPLRVVGVVESATWGSGSVRPTVYTGWSDEPAPAAVLLVGGRAGAQPTLGETLAALRPLGIALQPFGSLDGLLVRSRVLEVFLMRLALAFAAICLFVAVSGIYAHFVRWVRVRERSLAIRHALGAPRARLGATLLASVLKVVVPAAVLGGVAAVAAHGVVASTLGYTPGVTPRVVVEATILVVGLALLAIVVPAARAGGAGAASLLGGSRV